MSASTSAPSFLYYVIGLAAVVFILAVGIILYRQQNEDKRTTRIYRFIVDPAQSQKFYKEIIQFILRAVTIEDKNGFIHYIITTHSKFDIDYLISEKLIIKSEILNEEFAK